MAEDHRSRTEHDVDRISYSSAFRRLAGVTQVVAVDEIQLFHNRLTHTLKVAQLARRLAEGITRDPAHQADLAAGPGLDVSAAEAAALAHDLGHPPFGHIAEDVLQQRCDEAGADGFEGNAQSFRIVTKLSRRASDGYGLGLSNVTLRGILKYPWLRGPKPEDSQDKVAKLRHSKWGAYESEAKIFEQALEGDASEEKSPEATIMDWCDDISYALHDAEDFFRAGLIPLDRVGSVNEPDEGLWFMGQAEHELGTKPDFQTDAAHKAWKGLRGLFPYERYRGTHEDRRELSTMTSKFITRYFEAVSVHPVAPYVRIPVSSHHEVMLLKQLTWQYVVNSPALATMQQGQIRIVGELFDRLIEWLTDEKKRGTDHRLPARLNNTYEAFHADHDALDSLPTAEAQNARIVADYICCLTEDQAYDLHRRLYGNQNSSILEGWVRW